MIQIKKKAFTLVEILMAAGVTAIFLTMAITLFVRFSKNFSVSEGSSGLMQDCAIFVARLRNDLNNAVKTKDGFISVDENQVKFNIYDSGDGSIKPVIYSATKQSNGYYSMGRRIGNGANHILVNGKVASFKWKLNEEVIPTEATPFKRCGFELSIEMGQSDSKSKPYAFKVVIYPTRLNKMQ